jgi:superfamily I DNA/RNA helicase
MQWIDFSQSANQREKTTIFDNEQTKTKNIAIPGHALIRGVAGSGKSLILRDRINQVMEQGFDHVLVLSYNRYMKYLLGKDLYRNPEKYKTNIQCKSFHSWAYKSLNYSYDGDRDEETRTNLIKNAEKSNLKYQAILVDEAQDFYDEWLRALTKVLDPTTNSLFFAYDNTQSVYGQTHRRKSDWTWKSVDIDVPGGRSQIFDVNYRNSPEILELAWKFIKPSVEAADMGISKKGANPTIDKIIEPKKKATRSSGISPLLIQSIRSAMPAEIAQQVKMARQDYQDVRIGILLHPKAMSSNNSLQSEIAHHLSIIGINPIAPKMSEERGNDILNSGSVVIDSWNALKGMEFDAVIIAGVDSVISSSNQDENFKEKAGLYVAITRAKDHLVMLYERETDVVSQLHQALNSEHCLESYLND